MGIDFRVQSHTNPEFLKESQEQYCKWEWRYIRWHDVLDFLDINLAALANSAISWWSESQVAAMRDLIKELAEGDEDLLWDEDRKQRGSALQKDAAALLQHFERYVENDARIYVF